MQHKLTDLGFQQSPLLSVSLRFCLTQSRGIPFTMDPFTYIRHNCYPCLHCFPHSHSQLFPSHEWQHSFFAISCCRFATGVNGTAYEEIIQKQRNTAIIFPLISSCMHVPKMSKVYSRAKLKFVSGILIAKCFQRFLIKLRLRFLISEFRVSETARSWARIRDKNNFSPHEHRSGKEVSVEFP